MKLVVMRHGQTNYNKEHRLQGRKNIPLSDKGLSQAAATRDEMIAAGLHFDRALSSPLERAVQTAEIVGGVNREQIAREERIIEIDFGPLEGQQVESLDDNMRNFLPAWEAFSRPCGRTSQMIQYLRFPMVLHSMPCTCWSLALPLNITGTRPLETAVGLSLVMRQGSGK